MILAFKLSNLITIPFGYLLGLLNDLTGSYGLAMILFGIIVQLVMLPITAKSKKSMMGMSRLTPRMQELQAKYGNDQAKLNEMTQKLYQEEGVSMGGGCLWSLIPLFILIPLFTVIREPLTYVLGESAEVSTQIVATMKELVPGGLGGHIAYEQVAAAQLIPQYAAELKAAIPAISESTLEGMNFMFLGINLGNIPQFNIFAETWAWDWAHIGAFLMALLSCANSLVSMLVNQKTNDSVITNEKGIQDKEAAQNSQQAQSNKMMMWMMPIMSLWIGFTVPCALSLYWFVGGLVRTVEDAILTKHYRKIYDAEDAIRLKKALEQDRIEAEKERIRAEKRAANPDGITENTSKKKLQKQQRDQEAAAKAAGAKEYAAKKGIAEEEDQDANCMSGIPSRPYCKGRNYDPNRYASNSTEE